MSTKNPGATARRSDVYARWKFSKIRGVAVASHDCVIWVDWRCRRDTLLYDRLSAYESTLSARKRAKFRALFARFSAFRYAEEEVGSREMVEHVLRGSDGKDIHKRLEKLLLQSRDNSCCVT